MYILLFLTNETSIYIIRHNLLVRMVEKEDFSQSWYQKREIKNTVWEREITWNGQIYLSIYFRELILHANWTRFMYSEKLKRYSWAVWGKKRIELWIGIVVLPYCAFVILRSNTILFFKNKQYPYFKANSELGSINLSVRFLLWYTY